LKAPKCTHRPKKVPAASLVNCLCCTASQNELVSSFLLLLIQFCSVLKVRQPCCLSSKWYLHSGSQHWQYR